VIVKIREWKAGDEVTWQRMGKDVSWVAEEEVVVLGKIALWLWTSLSEPAEDYQQPGLWLFHQFGVEPTHQRRGIGSQLLEVAEEYLRRKGASELACDTAVSAGHLISHYERKGFQMVGKAAFAHTYYESVIPAKKL